MDTPPAVLWVAHSGGFAGSQQPPAHLSLPGNAASERWKGALQLAGMWDEQVDYYVPQGSQGGPVCPEGLSVPPLGGGEGHHALVCTW